MTNDQQIRPQAHAKDDKPLFIPGVFDVIDHKRFLVIEHGLSFLKRDPMLPFVDRVLVLIPFKDNVPIIIL